jgi:hypothetical protein
MTRLENWLHQATRRLSKGSAAQVRTEIQEHYESAREAAIGGGATAADAERLALAALGDAKTANRQYRRVLLTRSEAALLRDGNWEARMVCSHLWLKRLFLAASVAALFAAGASFFAGAFLAAQVALVVGLGTGFLFAAPLLPVYTPSRGRAFRIIKWIALIGALALLFGRDALHYSWLLFSCLWPMAWMEWKRMSIRRKMPVAQWPKQLYL